MFDGVAGAVGITGAVGALDRADGLAVGAVAVGAVAVAEPVRVVPPCDSCAFRVNSITAATMIASTLRLTAAIAARTSGVWNHFGTCGSGLSSIRGSYGRLRWLVDSKETIRCRVCCDRALTGFS